MNSRTSGNWYRWTPANAESDAYQDLVSPIDEFESLDTAAGREAARWLREDALLDYPSTITYVLLSERRIDGFFAIASDSVKLIRQHRRELAPGQDDYLPAPVQGASLIAWIARHKEGGTPGRDIMLYALSIALKVARLQGTPVTVLDPYDDATALLWEERYGFRRSGTSGGNDVRLWVPLHRD